LIGPGGKNIRAIQEQTGATIDVEDDGTVTVAAADLDKAKSAMSRVEACTATVQIGKIYEGVVTSIRDFGAFVEVIPGRDGLVHVSELTNGYVSNVNSVCKVGDSMQVLVIDIDDHDRVRLSRRRALEELGIEDEFANRTEGDEPPQEEGGEGRRDFGDRPPREGGGYSDRPPRSGGGGGRDRRGGGGGGRDRRGGGGGGGRDRR
jgi:polyribonucleotide nucleotidyltransferase